MLLYVQLRHNLMYFLFTRNHQQAAFQLPVKSSAYKIWQMGEFYKIYHKMLLNTALMQFIIS